VRHTAVRNFEVKARRQPCATGVLRLTLHPDVAVHNKQAAAAALLAARDFLGALRAAADCVQYIGERTGSLEDVRLVHCLLVMALAYDRAGVPDKALRYYEAVAAMARTHHAAVLACPQLAVAVGCTYAALGERCLRAGNASQAQVYLWAQCGILVSCHPGLEWGVPHQCQCGPSLYFMFMGFCSSPTPTPTPLALGIRG
jgi:hypothetical protein